uniref:Decaprenyl-diphosphate synthase subunit 1 n=1 Tax=Timema shepardi TaxID=629360 RepID=A0A7R9BAV7_TIMSH|nr:unnamed protein product [Timema shepardi]
MWSKSAQNMRRADNVAKFVRLVLELRRNTALPELQSIATYYFDGQGKALRPMVAILMARAINYHLYKESSLLRPQRQVAMISEMIHSASLIHDDVIDQSDFRRGKPSVNVLWNHKKCRLGKIAVHCVSTSSSLVPPGTKLPSASCTFSTLVSGLWSLVVALEWGVF